MTVAEKILRAKDDYNAVYESGYAKGKAEGVGDAYDEGFEAGKVAEYDAFWDAFQDDGNRTNYSYAFNHWTNENFKPKYDINATDFQYAFRYSTITDLVEILKKQDVKLDVSNATNLQSVFFYSDSITTCPTIDVSKSLIKDFAVFTHAHAMKTIEKIILPTGKVMTFTNSFHTCTNLENIVFEGDIMANGVSFQWSPKLSKDSIVSVVNALSPYTSDLTVTFSKTAVESAFDSEEIVLHPYNLDHDYFARQGHTVTDNGDGSVTVNGGNSDVSSSYFYFFDDILPAGVYEVSFSQTGEGYDFAMACSIYDGDGGYVDAFPVDSGSSHRITVGENGRLSLEMDLMGVYTNKKMMPTLKRLPWETLKATKPNWTITEV